MNSISKILVIVDPTATEHPSLVKAARLAEKLDARLELFVCDTKASREARLAAHTRERSGQPFLLNLKPLLESLAAPLRARGLDVATEIECADPLHVALVDRARRTTADLIVKDTHHHSIAQRTFLTNTDWQLIRGCPIPLLLTKPRPWAETLRIAAAVDPGHTNDKPMLLDHRILEHASLFAQRLGGDLHVLHAYVPMAVVAVTTAGMAPLAAVSAHDLAIERDAKLGQLAALASDYRVPATNIHLEVGGPGEMLPRMARTMHADVLAMGAISRTGLQRVFIGSTAEDVLEHLPCDALIVKPPDFESLLPF
jgi:universal stress protein E